MSSRIVETLINDSYTQRHSKFLADLQKLKKKREETSFDFKTVSINTPIIADFLRMELERVVHHCFQ